MKRGILLLTVIIAIALGFHSCGAADSLFGEKITEGKINYKVSFPEMGPDHMIASIMPDEMEITFKDHKYNSEFSTYGGVFKNKVSIDTKERNYSQMLKIFKKRLACDYDKVDLDEFMRDFPPFTIVKSNEIDTIAGIPCKKAHGVFYELDVEDIEIFYTDRIAIKNPNWCSPFAELDGFLLGYDIDMFNMRLRLRAEELTETEVDDEEFAIEDGYKRVSYKYIKLEIEKLMDSFDI